MSVYDYCNLVKLELDKEYIVENVHNGNMANCILVKSSPKGYALYCPDKSKFITARGQHIYPNRLQLTIKNELWFFITKHLKITEKIKTMKESSVKNQTEKTDELKPRSEFEKEMYVMRFNDICNAISKAYASRTEIKLEWIEEYNELLPKVK
jgi:hypothetical protein